MSPALACSTISCLRIISRVRGRDPAGISLEFSCIRTLCQSANLLSWRNNAHLFLLAHVALTHIIGCKLYTWVEISQRYLRRVTYRTTKWPSNEHCNLIEGMGLTNLSIFKLLFNIFHYCPTVQTFESSLKKLRPHFTCSCHHSTNWDQFPNFYSAQLP